MKPGSCGGVAVSVDVRGLLGSSGTQSESAHLVAVPPLETPEGQVRFEPARVKLVLTSAPDGIAAWLSVESRAEVYCSRCLTRFSEGVSGEADHMFVVEAAPPVDSPARGFHSRGKVPADAELSAEQAHDDEGPETSPVVNGQIDILPLVMDVLSLSLSMKPLCRPDCKGLCPTCGCNLNESSCRCTDEAIDPRLARLEALLQPDPGAQTADAAGKSKEKDQRGRTKT